MEDHCQTHYEKRRVGGVEREPLSCSRNSVAGTFSLAWELEGECAYVVNPSEELAPLSIMRSLSELGSWPSLEKKNCLTSGWFFFSRDFFSSCFLSHL